MQDIGIVLPVDLTDPGNVPREAVKHDPVGERVHRAGAPAEGIGQRPEFRRDQGGDPVHRLLHLVILIPHIDAGLLLSELVPEAVDAVFHSFFLSAQFFEQ